MKGFLFCQRRFAIIAHAIAASLTERHGVKDFCGYVSLRSSWEYLKLQKNVNYTALLLDEDIHEEYKQEKIDYDYLAFLEKEYGIPNAWPYLLIDRVIRYNQLVREYPYDTPPYTHEEMLRILQVKAKKIIALFDQEKPDFIFMILVSNLGSMLMYHIAKKRNIKVLVGMVGRIGDLFLLSENYSNNSWADALFEKIQHHEIPATHLQEAKTFLHNFRTQPAPFHPDSSPLKQAVNRKKQLSFLNPKNIIKSLSWFATLTKNYFSARHHDYDDIKPWYYMIDHVKRKIRCLIGYDDLYDTVEKTEDYAFFPLHYDPEIATMLYAPFFTDQIYVIKQIARSLPVHFKLYIKEHPAMVGYRTRAYYQELKKIPNVKLINPSIPSFSLTKNARLITTITGTAGWEALLLGKPVITFGNVFFNKISSVKQCRTIEELPYLIKAQLEQFSYQENEVLNYISAMFADGIDIPLITLWEKEIDHLDKIKHHSEKIADLIAKKLKNDYNF